MINIDQTSNNIKNLDDKLDKLGVMDVEIYRDAIENDVEKLKVLMEKAKSKTNRKNIQIILEWLSQLLVKIEDTNNIEYSFLYDTENKSLKQYPFTFTEVVDYNISFMNYTKVKSGNVIVEFDYSQLANIIALDMMYKDILDEEFNVEKEMRNIGIVGVYDAQLLIDIIKKYNAGSDNVYTLSKGFKVGKSPYGRFKKRMITDYFNTHEYSSDSYREAVAYSCRTAMVIILYNLMDSLRKLDIDFQLYSVTNRKIYIGVEKEEFINKMMKLDNSVSIRTFGRKFKTNPEVKVY